MRFYFSKKEKLKSKKLITLLFNEGKSINSYPVKLIYLPTTLSTNVQVQTMVTVPKRNFKSAVKRNRIKRYLRESYRLNKAVVLDNSDQSFAFLFLYLGKKAPNYQLIDKNLQAVLHKFKTKIGHE